MLSPTCNASIDVEMVENMVVCIKKGANCPCGQGGSQKAKELRGLVFPERVRKPQGVYPRGRLKWGSLFSLLVTSYGYDRFFPPVRRTHQGMIGCFKVNRCQKQSLPHGVEPKIRAFCEILFFQDFLDDLNQLIRIDRFFHVTVWYRVFC